MKLSSIFLVLLAMASVACHSERSINSQPPEALHDGFVFVSSSIRPGGDLFFLSTVDGALRQLTDTAVGNQCPSVSPDGTQIVFQRLSTYYIMNVDGSGARDLTPSLPYRFLGCPVWSRDGRKVAFTRNQPRVKEPGTSELYVVNVDGSGLNRLAMGDTYGSVAWSPDGRRMLFESNRYTDGGPYDYGVNLINADGTGAIRIENALHGVTWSPSGDRIAFFCGANIFLAWRVCVAPPDGRAGTAITASAESVGIFAGALEWSPDGSHIAFSCTTGICSVAPDGSDLITLTTRPGSNTPRWSPKSDVIVYSCIVNSKRTICAVNADGTNDGVLVTLPGENLSPSWSPSSQ